MKKTMTFAEENKMKVEEMMNLIEANGFKCEGNATLEGFPVFARKWEREDNLCWVGTTKTTLEVECYMAYGTPYVRVYKDGKLEGKLRNYSSPKRAMNAISEVVRFAGFEF